MADQPGGTTAGGVIREPEGLRPSALAPTGAMGSAGRFEPYHGKPVSWVAIGIVIAGFIAAGAGLIAGPVWWLFWLGAGLAALGGIVALATGIFNDWY